MKTTVMVMDVFVRFRIIAIAQSERQAQAWEMQVVIIEVGCSHPHFPWLLDSKVAALLTEASTPITPHGTAR